MMRTTADASGHVLLIVREEGDFAFLADEAFGTSVAPEFRLHDAR